MAQASGLFFLPLAKGMRGSLERGSPLRSPAATSAASPLQRGTTVFSGSLRPPPSLRGISDFPIAEAADFGVGFDGFGAVGTFAGACGVGEGTFLEGALVVFHHLLDALRIPFGVAVAVDLVGPA